MVNSLKELLERIAYVHDEFDSPALLEEYIEGREIYAAVLGNDKPEALPLVELDLSKLPEGMPRIAGYEVKFDVTTEAYKKTKSAPARDLDEETGRRASSRPPSPPTAPSSSATTAASTSASTDERPRLRHRGQPESLARPRRRIRDGREGERPVVHADDRGDRGAAMKR